MTTIEIHGVTLSAHAGLNMGEAFPGIAPIRPARQAGDYAQSNAGKHRRNMRRARIAVKAVNSFLAREGLSFTDCLHSDDAGFIRFHDAHDLTGAADCQRYWFPNKQ